MKNSVLPANELSNLGVLVYPNTLPEPRCYTLGETVGLPEQ
jgi:hypothetical protein